MQIQISWLLQKPTDLDLHCLQRQGISRFSRTGDKKGTSYSQTRLCICHFWFSHVQWTYYRLNTTLKWTQIPKCIFWYIFCMGFYWSKVNFKQCLQKHLSKSNAGLGGSVGCGSGWWSGGWRFEPSWVDNILSWRLIMKYLLWAFSPFRWFKKDSCHFLAEDCA